MSSTPTPDLVKLASLVRDVCEQPQYKATAHYASQLAELMNAHDQMSKLPMECNERRRLWGLATKLYSASRVHALRHNLEAPNTVLRSLGYSV
jgi:hypothetical protein